MASDPSRDIIEKIGATAGAAVGGEDFKDIMGLVGSFSKDLKWCFESSIDRLSKEHKAVFAGV